MLIDFHRFSSMFHWLPIDFNQFWIYWFSLISIDFHWFPLGRSARASIFFDLYRFLLIFIDSNWLGRSARASISIDVHRFCLVGTVHLGINFHWFSLISIDFHRFLFAGAVRPGIDFHRHARIFIDFHWFSLISIDFHWFLTIFACYGGRAAGDDGIPVSRERRLTTKHNA